MRKCVVAGCEHVRAPVVYDVLVLVHTPLVAEVADGVGNHVVARRRSYDLPVLALLVLRNPDGEGRQPVVALDVVVGGVVLNGEFVLRHAALPREAARGDGVEAVATVTGRQFLRLAEIAGSRIDWVGQNAVCAGLVVLLTRLLCEDSEGVDAADSEEVAGIIAIGRGRVFWCDNACTIEAAQTRSNGKGIGDHSLVAHDVVVCVGVFDDLTVVRHALRTREVAQIHRASRVQDETVVETFETL